MKTKLISLLLALLMVVTSVPAFTLFTTAEEAPASEPYNYNKLYVGYNEKTGKYENVSLILDFFSATPEDEVKKSSNYNVESINAADRFTAASSTYDKFTVYTAAPKGSYYVTGGTTPAKSPWKFTNWYQDSYWPYSDGSIPVKKAGSGSVKDMRTAANNYGPNSTIEANKAYTSTTTKSGETVYVTTTVVTGVTEYYIGNGEWAKCVRASNFDYGFMHMGMYTFLNVTNAQKAAKAAGDGSYTIEYIVEKISSDSGFTAYVGDRIGISQSGKKVYFNGGYKDDYSNFTDTTTTFEADLNDVNTFTFTFNRTDTSAVTVGAFLNTNSVYSQRVTEIKNEDNGQNVEGADANFYAVRVYNYVLSEAEVLQNHFADLAKFYQIDMLDYDALPKAKKAVIHNALRDFKITTLFDEDNKAAIEAAYFDAYVEANKTGNEYYDAFIETVINNGYSIAGFADLTKTQKETVIIRLSASEFTQADIDAAIEAVKVVKENTTTEEQYNSLYVQDGALLLADFFSAKEGDYLTAGGKGTVKYEGYYGKYVTDDNGDYVLDENGNKTVEWVYVSYSDAPAGDKFNGTSTNYAPYVHTVNTFKNASGATRTPYLSGGTLPMADDDIIVTKMSNTATSNIGATTYKAKTTIGDYDYYLYEHADDLGNASVYTLRVPKGEDLSKRNTKVDGVTYGFEQYVVTTGALSETYVQSNGNLAYTSSFHDGYFSNGAVSGIMLGELSTFVTTGAQASAASGGEEHVKYSIQIIYSNDLERWMKGTNGSGIAMFGPPRGTIDNISSTNKNLKVSIYANRGKITSGFNTVYLDVAGDAITDFTFAYDSTYTSFATADNKGVDTKGTMDMDIFVNGKLINGINIANGSNVVYYDDSVADQNKTLSVNLDQTNKTTDTNYKFGENGATNIYAIRYYGKTLTTAEIRQNHFADVVKRNKVDVSNFFSLNKAQKQEMYNLFADITLDAKTTAELQEIYDKKYEDLIWTELMEEGNDSHNHVIDLARYYSLDLTLYNSLTAQVKEALYVYTNKQTLDESIFDMDMAVMFEAWIYEALKFVAAGGETVEEINALDLFVKEGLQYHISFLKAEGTGDLVTKEIMANYVLFNAEGNTVYLAPYSSKAANAPYLMDGYLKLYNESDSTYHGASLNDMTAINASEYYTQEQVIKVAKTSATSTQMWLQPFMRVTAKSATGVSSVSISRWGRQGWSPFPMVYTTLGVKANSLNLIPQTSDFKVTDAQTYTFVYERDFTKTTYVYNSADYGETNKVVNEYDKDDSNKGIKKGDHVATYTDTYYANYKSGSTKLPVILPTLTPERIAAIKEAGWVVKDAEGNVTDYLRSNTSDFEGATIIMTGTMAVTGYINANKAYTLAEQPYTNSTGVTNIGADSNASYLNFYALRLYNRALSQTEIAQNHFADLAYKFDFELDIFALLSEDQRKEVYEAMKSYHVSDEKAVVVDAYTDALKDLYYSSEEETPTENELHFYELAMYYKLNLTQFNKLGRDSQFAIYDEFAEVVAGEMSAIEIALLLQKAIDYQLGDYFARDLVTFEGYQARLTQFAGIRATFNYDSEKLAELEADGCSVEFGVIMAIASEGRTAKDLTLKKSDGAYVATGKQMLASAVYKNGIATGNIIENEDDEARPRFVYSIIYEKESSKTAQMYALDCIYRAYVVVTKDGNDYVTYFDCESERFGESISAYELSTCWFYDENLDNEIIREVIDTVGYTEEAIALYTQYAETVEKIEKEGIMSLSFDELNFLYNIQLKADKNNVLKLNLKYYEESGKTSEVDGNTDVYGGIDALINAYNAFHGVDVRDDLYEITGESEIVYFDVSTDKDPHTYTMGDSITFNVNIRDKDSDQLISADKISYTYKIDGVSGSKSGTASAPAGKFSVTIPASEISASSLAGKGIVVNLVGTIEDLTHEKLVAGAVVDYDKITNSAEKPADYDTFWQETLNAIKSVSPTDTTVTPYTGDGVVISDIKRTEDENGHATYSTESGRTISEDNYFHLVPVDEERLAYLKSKGYNETISADRLTTHYIYEVYLKSPGPNPSVGVITMPKNPTASTKIILSFAGYSASSPSISLWDNNIRFNVSHNGYWVDASKVELYDKLNTSGILGSYGKVNSKPNSTYTNKSDNYILYLFLRNLQALRFVTELPVSTDGIEDVHLKTVYDTLIKTKSLGGGAITLSGSSMGGFQSLSLAGMAEMYGIQIADVIATVPAFCNPSSATIDGRIDDGFGIGYEENMRYFDPAFFASYIDVTNEVYIDRCGLGDYTCPPSGIIAAYNAIKSQKKIVFYQNSDHGYKIDEAIYKFTVTQEKVTTDTPAGE